MVIGPRRESSFGRLEPIKNKRGQEGKFEMKFEKKVIPNGPEEDEIYLKSLILARHLKIWA
jgi:hypothetical protein